MEIVDWCFNPNLDVPVDLAGSKVHSHHVHDATAKPTETHTAMKDEKPAFKPI